MDKLMITKEQMEALKEFNNTFGLRHGVDYKLEQFIKQHSDYRQSITLRPISTFTTEQFALLLCGWYEVEEPLKDGDKIIYPKWNVIGEVKGDTVYWSDNCKNKLSDVQYSFNQGDYRKATAEEIAQEKERRKWAEIGRESGDYRKGDIVSTGSIIRVVVGTQNESIFIEGMPFTNDYTAEELFMVCPVEQRHDK